MNLLKQLFGTDVPAISAAQAREMIDAKQAHLVLDVRQPHEYQSGHISGAKLIPLNELPNRMKQLPKDRPIIAVCHSGSRSVHADRCRLPGREPARRDDRLAVGRLPGQEGQQQVMLMVLGVIAGFAIGLLLGLLGGGGSKCRPHPTMAQW